MGFTRRDAVVAAVSVTIASVLAPVAVYAATGQLVNLVDGTTGVSAKVSGQGALQVKDTEGAGETYGPPLVSAAVGPGARATLTSSYPPFKTGIRELTVTAHYAGTYVVYINAYRRVSGTAACPSGTSLPSGFVATVLRVIAVNGPGTEQLVFPGPGLQLAAPGAGHFTCLTMVVSQAPTGGLVRFSGVLYRYA